MKTNFDNARVKYAGQLMEENVHLGKRAIYEEGINLLRKRERVSYFISLTISLVLVILMFIVLMVS